MELVYKRNEDLILNNIKPLQDFEGTEPEELLIFQCPITQVTVAKDEISGRFENSSGVDAIVFFPYEEESILGVTKVFRQVSLVRYPEPKELLETMKAKTRQNLVGAATDSAGKNSDPTRSSRHKSGQLVRHSASTRSSKQKRMLSGHTETPKSSKRKHSESPSGSSKRSWKVQEEIEEGRVKLFVFVLYKKSVFDD